MSTPRITQKDLVEYYQGYRLQRLDATGKHKVRYVMRIDTSYREQSFYRAEVWTSEGWKELWSLDPMAAPHERIGPKMEERVLKAAREALRQLGTYVTAVLGEG